MVTVTVSPASTPISSMVLMALASSSLRRRLVVGVESSDVCLVSITVSLPVTVSVPISAIQLARERHREAPPCRRQ